MRGLAFRDQPSPPGSEFNTPRASAAGRASSITDDEGQFETPRATAAGAFGSMNPVQLQGPVFQVFSLKGKCMLTCNALCLCHCCKHDSQRQASMYSYQIPSVTFSCICQCFPCVPITRMCVAELACILRHRATALRTKNGTTS